MTELNDLTNSALKLSGVASRNFRFCKTPLSSGDINSWILVVHRCQRTLVAIPGYGVPFLRHFLPLAVRSQGVLNALLTLSDRLRLSDAQVRQSYIHDGNNGFLESAEQTILGNYQEALSRLQSSLLSVQSGLQDAEEAVALSVILLIFGFPGHRVWSVHLNGLIAQIQDPEIPTLDSPSLSLMALNLAAHVDIKAFSLGRAESSQRLWWSGRMHQLEQNVGQQSAGTSFSDFEVSTGYPESLVTLIALVSAVVEDIYSDRALDPTIEPYLQSATDNHRTIQHIVADVEFLAASSTQPADSHLDDVLRTELVIAQWKPPPHPESLAVDTSLALATVWEIMRKSVFIYLWRRGFDTDIRAILSTEYKLRIGRLLREALAGTELVMQAAEQHDITVANALIWPLTVLGNECAWHSTLQPKVLEYFQRLNNHFPIHHSRIVANLLRKLWKLTEERSSGSDALPFGCLSLQYLALQDNACVPLL
ncbi:fungal-specific transcription factor domain-containing protein [Aspergillus granulosus]|uniref:Fungal-specific transcription factor domain-containing protein n=1 Tax=Aspergillus granulosus TaxID=176169 RepID=A0ABR4HQ64_9EURO